MPGPRACRDAVPLASAEGVLASGRGGVCYVPDSKGSIDVSQPQPANRVRAGLDHPVIDADGHLIEFLPALRDHLIDVGGRQLSDAFDQVMNVEALVGGLDVAQRRSQGLFKMSWWAFPSRNSMDRATGMLPRLLYERLDEIGVDYAVVYPTLGLMPLSLDAPELRCGVARAINRYNAELFADHRDRLEPVAVIPMHEPAEAIEELEYCTRDLGFKAAVLAGLVLRPLGENLPRAARWLDTFGAESPYDYDPVWAKCVELGIAPTFHSSAMGWGSRISQKNYMANHVGNFAAAGEATCRSLFFHGVPRRFPELRCAFLEGGVSWGCGLYADLIGHWQKRGAEGVRHYDPAKLDRALVAKLFASHGSDRYKKHMDELDAGLRVLCEPGPVVDEFEAAGITSAEDIRDVFVRNFHFGCEADDPANAGAFDSRRNPLGARLPAIFSSDIGHWDVLEMRGVLHEAWELVEDGLLTRDDFRDFTFGNAARMWAGANPRFFEGTSVDSAVAALLA